MLRSLLNFSVLIFVFHLISTSICYKILGLFHHHGKSHMDIFHPLMRGLAEKGHEVTVVSHFPMKSPPDNFTEIILSNLDVMLNHLPMAQFQGYRSEKYMTVPDLEVIGWTACDAGYKSKSLQNFLKSKQSFDVIIVEFFNSDCFLGIANKFKAPIIGVTSSIIMPWTNNRFGNPDHPAYVPHIFMDYSDEMNFFERLEGTLFRISGQLYYDYIIRKNDEKFIRKYVNPQFSGLHELVYNSSLLLVNSHFSLNLPRPLVPSIIEVGGIHIQKNKLPPNNLEKFINESEHGVIYFSMGSMIKGNTFPQEKREEFLKAFARLPQRVLWKYENATMPGKPDNVMIQKWMPQLDILCHPNVIAFISHGGLLGTTEAVHCGVPVVVMPIFGDQHTNARALEASGGGVILQLHTATEEKVYNALQTVLDPNFRKGAKELSARFRDRPLPPLETAIYWVEYVARHRGAHHMRTAAVGMPFYKYFLLDVIAFLLLIFGIIAAITFYIWRAIFRAIRGKFFSKAKVKTN